MLAASFCSYVGIAILEEKGSQDWLVLQVTNINKQCLNSSGVARLGHTGACALATGGRAPPVQVRIQIIGTDSIVVDRESGAKRS